MKNIKKDEEGEKNSAIDIINHSVQRKKRELTELEKQERLALSGMLLEKREDLIRAKEQRDRRKKDEIIELQSGLKFTHGEVERIIAFEPMPYKPLYSYTEPWFPQMYRMYYPGRDYKEYPKPFYFATLFKELIYYRFDESVFKTLDYLNPIITGRYYRKHKLFQNLNQVGQSEAIKFSTDASNIAKNLDDGQHYEFRKRMYSEHGVGYQVKMFSDNN